MPKSYTVSKPISTACETLITHPAVAVAMAFLEKEQKLRMEEQIAIASIPAPTFHERQRAEALCRYFNDLGLSDVRIDAHGNAIGIRRGIGDGPRVLIEAHMDTVFPMDTPLEPRFEGTKVFMPGINDNASGLASLLSIVRGLGSAGIETIGELWFVGTVEEEGRGCLGGMEKLVRDNYFDASISMDCAGFGFFAWRGTAIRSMVIHFHSQGGHASASFGQVANALYAAARAVTKIAEFRVPHESQTIYCVSNFHAGSDAAINAVAPDACIKINYRSNNQADLEALHTRILAACEQAAKEETARWGMDTVTWDYETTDDLAVAVQDVRNPLVQAMVAVYRAMGVEEPRLLDGGACNVVPALQKGIQGVCIGTGGAGNAHTLDEYYDAVDMHQGPQSAMLAALMMVGVHGCIEPQAQMSIG